VELVFDIEASGLLDDSSIDYLASPYRLNPSYKFHCLVVYNRTTKEMLAWGPENFVEGVEYIKQNATVLIGHNTIDYDLLALKLGFDFDYTITPKHTICGRKVKIVDTLVMSKTLNPDRLGHSIEWWGNKLGCQKIDWRGKAIELDLIPHNAPKGEEFATYHPEMLEYNKQDVVVNNKVYDALLEEAGNWNWADALELEHAVRDIITRQSHRGFWFNREKAEANVRELDEMMAATRAEVEPHLPPKPMTKGKLADSTPPKNQFKKDGSVSALMLKFADKTGAAIEDGMFIWNGQSLPLPLPAEALITEEPASIEDTTHIKGWLISLGWNPVNYKERDLTCDAKKKKLTKEKYLDTVERYKEQTIGGPFEKDRVEHLASYLRCSKMLVWKKMEAHDITRPMKVLTNPTLTVGQDKELCPNLELLAEKFPYAEKIVKFLTYRHRRNSILGGGVGLDDEDAEMEKGFLANVRADGRIATPADTCGTGTSRFKHKTVANIPRVTSIYGENMRAMFGVDRNTHVQLGYDFDSLEARIEADGCWKYDPDKEYCNSLIQAKPNDCHTKLAEYISELLSEKFERGPAKNVKYACLPLDNTEVLTPVGWKFGHEVAEGDIVMGYNQTTRRNEWTTVKATHHYKNARVVKVGHTLTQLESTEDHRWYGQVLKQYGNNRSGRKVWEDCVLRTSELKQTFNILNTAPFVEGCGGILPHEAALIAWLLSDGYYKWSELSERTSSSGGARKGIVASIGQASHTYQKEVEGVLTANHALFVVDLQTTQNENTMNIYRFKSEWIRNFLDRVVGSREQKHHVNWCEWVLKLNKESLEAFVYNFWLADGDSKGNSEDSAWTVRQNEGNICEAVALAGYLLGWNITIRGKTKVKTVRMQKMRPHTTCQEFRLHSERLTGVFCLTTGLDTFVVKQNGIITITGNCAYNAQPARIAKTIGKPLQIGEIVFNAYWDKAFPLKALKERMQKYWETTGQKKFLLGLDGRKLPIRSKGNCINTRFQSSGVVCAKRAMVIHEQKLREHGLVVDFFRDDWKNKPFATQMIAYHDEAQLEVDKRLVKWKLFKTEEEAKAFKKENPDWSDVGHSSKGWYVGYCQAGVLAVEAVREAGEYYNLNIELTAGYMLGIHWASCH